MFALEAKGISYRLPRLNNTKGEQKNPRGLKINPRGHVPVLVINHVVVAETRAVLSDIDPAHPEPPLFGNKPEETARIWQIMSECGGHPRGPVEDISRPIFRGKMAEFQDKISAAAQTVRGELKNPG